jgi:hypothetical protein
MLSNLINDLLHTWPQFVVLAYAIAGVSTAFRLLPGRQAFLVLVEAVGMLVVLYFGGFWNVLK